MDFLLPGERKPEQTSDRIPMALARFTVSSAQRHYKKFEEGEILSQVLSGKDYSIWAHHFFITHPITLYPYTNENLLTLHYMIKGNIHVILKGHGKVLLEQGKYHLFYVPGGIKHEAEYFPGHYYSFHINYHPNHLKPFAKQYPVFEPMLSNAEKGLKVGEMNFAATITYETKTIIDDIICNPMQPAERALFLEAKVRDLLRIYVHDFVIRDFRLHITDKQERLLKEVEAYVEAHLDAKLSVDGISQQFNISRSWLQLLCKNKYEKGVHQLVTQKRMEAAARLLLSTKEPVSTIVMLTSDMTFAAFSAAFHQYYHITPLQYRKGGGQKP